ncbi:MAG: choice-of-anchor J domain-containing protein [Muribaculaceae bacterium]|nr:choice-of-anchor J domain-containing protein [Muribaculaceae bacterium]
MRKSFLKTLSVGLTLMIVSGASAAPLLPRATSSGQSASAAAVPIDQMPQQLPVTFPQPLMTRALDAAQLEGLRPLTSDVVVQNRRAVMSATAANRAISKAVGLEAYVFYGKYPKGVYTIPRSATEDFEIVLEPTYSYSCNFGCVFDGNVIHMGVVENGYYGATYYYVEVDANTGSQLKKTKLSSGQYDILAQACALDPTTGDVYGVFMSKDFNTKNWAKANYAAIGSTVIKADFDQTIMGLGCDDSGQFYGLTIEGSLLKIDKTTGDYEVIAQTDVVSGSTYAVSGCVNSKDNTFIQSTMTSSSASALYEVDLATGATTKLLDFGTGYQFGGLHTWAYPEKAPEAPEVNLACEMGSLDATVTLTMPTTLFDGTPVGDQELTYYIKYGSSSTDIREGTAAGGVTVTETITFPFPGMKEITVYCHNDGGDSPKVKSSIFVGKGTPKAPQNVVLTWADDVATLTWEPVTESSDLGYFNPDDIRYDITDLSGTLVKEDVEGTTATFEVSEPATGVISVGYKVKAKNGDRKSGETASNSISLGHYSAPVTIEFSSKDIFNQHTVVDANADGKTWSYSTSKVAEYAYHSSNNADDWLFTPGIELTEGKAYSVKATAVGSSSYPEKMEIKAGQGVTPEAMTINVADVMLFNTGSNMVQEGFFLCTQSGLYNIGFHAVSDANMNRLKISKYEVEELSSCLIPAAVTDLTVNPSTIGDLTATITFTLPVKSILDDDLDGEVTYTLLCGDRTVKTATAAVGEAVTVDDTVTAEGDYTYSVVCANATGTGPKATATAFIGPLAATPPTSFTVSKAGDNTLHFTWSAVTSDVAGHQLPAENITYTLFAIEDGYATGILADGITACEYDLDIVMPANQEVVVYGLAAFNRGKNSSLVGAQILLGDDYQLPVVYTNPASLDDYALFIQGSANVGFGSASTIGISAADGDDSYFVIQNSNAGGIGALFTGNIAITGESPMLSFYVYRLVGENDLPDMNKTTVQILTADGELVTLDEFAHYEKLPEGNAWNRVRYSLEQFAGQTIRVRILGEAVGFVYNFYDAISIYNEVPYDLAVTMAAPKKVATGETFPLTIDIVNAGARAVDAFTVNILRNGEMIDSYTFDNGLGFEETEHMELTSSIGLHDEASAVYTAVVEYAADGNADNNQASATVNRIIVDYPVPTNLAGENVAEGLSLTWAAPEMPEQTVIETTETFESAESFADDYDGWLFIDNDQTPIGGFTGLEIPGHPSRSNSSFFIFDTDLLDDTDSTKATFEARSGNKYLACIYAMQGALDDWAVSPRLTGEQQEISFYARSYSSSYPEKIEVYVTMSDDAANLEAYQCVMQAVMVPKDWTEYKVTLPAGARHFAIRSCAEDSFMLLVDDVTFKRLEGFDGNLLGYNVYCDGAQINDATVEDAAHIHTDVAEGSHTYHVTAVYDKGESELSEPLLLEKSDIEMIAASAQPTVKADGRIITVSNADGLKVDIYTTDGRTIHSTLGNTRKEVAPAIYMVRVGTVTSKVIVR